MAHIHMTRSQFHHDDLTLSYLDTGGEGQPLIALHALWMEAATYTRLVAALSPEWRVIAMDQRGHGYSDHALSYTRKDFIGDVAALVEHLEVDKVVLLGNSPANEGCVPTPHATIAAIWPGYVWKCPTWQQWKYSTNT